MALLFKGNVNFSKHLPGSITLSLIFLEHLSLHKENILLFVFNFLTTLLSILSLKSQWNSILRDTFPGHFWLIIKCRIDFINTTCYRLYQAHFKVDPMIRPSGTHSPVNLLPLSVGGTCGLLQTSRIWQQWWAVMSIIILHKTVTSDQQWLSWLTFHL